jgi:methionyl-tRNA synthetase
MVANLDLVAYFGVPLYVIATFLIWSLIWKGIALWKSARKNHLLWFVMLLLVNTLGILEILYIFIFSKLGEAKSKTKKKKR